jgi:hypothetical protein
MSKSWINNTHGMELKPIECRWQKRQNENGIVFYAMLDLLENNNQRKDQFNSIVEVLQTWKEDKIVKGLYDRGAYESNIRSMFYVAPELRRKISHDNITAISRLSAKYNLPYNKDIARYAIRKLFLFDNRFPESPKITSLQFHPRDWFFWLYNGGGIYKAASWLFFPVFFLANIVTCFTPKEETSGKQLMFIRLYKQKNILLKINFKICSFILRKRYETKKWLSKIVDIYYHQREDNPIRILAKDLEL